MRIADRLWINAETATFSALAQQPYKQKVLRRKNAKTRKFTKKIFLTGGRFFRKLFVFFTSCLLVHKLCLFFTSYLATHKLFLTLQAVCRHTIVSIFCKLLSDTQLLLFTSCLFSSNCANFTSRLPVQIIASIFQNLLVAQLP